MDWIELGYLGLFLGTFLAATILPFSSEFILTGMLLVHYDPFVCFIVATSGNTLGSTITYGIGRLITYQKALQKLRIKEKNIQRTHSFFLKYGIWIALFSWVPIIGDAGVFLLGSNRVNFWFTMLLVLIGKAVRFAVVIYVFIQLS
ncbi:MAG: YqaA family protein [Crocinitomicaceae bacterium]